MHSIHYSATPVHVVIHNKSKKKRVKIRNKKKKKLLY